MIDILSWLLAVEILGLLGLPVCLVLFRRLPDRGITLAKPLALVLFSYVLWIAGLTHLVPNTLITIVLILIFGAIVSSLLLRRHAGKIWRFLKEEWRTLVVAEALFLGFFFLWLAIISEVPAINHTEKPMDFGFMNAVLQSRYFPPEDHWLAGHSISYYYFGHLMMAFLTKLSAVPSSVSYNMAVALVPGMLAAASFGLVYNLVRLSNGSRLAAMGFGLAAPALIMLIGNLEGALEFVHAQGWGGNGFWEWVGIKGLEGTSASSGVFPDQSWWWWRGSRVIDTLAGSQSLDFTITEFPMFSYLLGDLHPHVMSLPFVVLGLSLGLNLFRSKDRLGPAWLRRNPWEFLAVALFIGALGFINTWDLPMMAGVLIALVLVKCYRDCGSDLRQGIVQGASVLIPIFAVAAVLFLPFYLTVNSQASGIAPLREVSTRPFLFFVTMGLFSVLALSFILRQLPGLRRPTKLEAPMTALVLGVTLTPVVIWVGVVFSLTLAGDGFRAALNEVGGRMVLVLPGLAITIVAALSAALRSHQGAQPTAVFPLLLISISFYLLVGAELFYVADLFDNRMNTVFKLYYQTWLLLGLAGVYGLFYWQTPGTSPQAVSAETGTLSRRALRLGNVSCMGGIAFLVIASAYYSAGAILDRTGLLRQEHTLGDNTLNGLAFVREGDPGEYAAIEWLRDEAPWGRIVEAVGDDYSDFGRISASTGLPTVLGWKFHEVQWRGNSEIYNQREEDVAQIYSSGREDTVRRLLETYEVRYVYVGERERTQYRIQNLEGFDSFLNTAFDQQGVVIYELVNGAGGGPRGQDGNGPG